jgi:hypothetical protein
MGIELMIRDVCFILELLFQSFCSLCAFCGPLTTTNTRAAAPLT